MKNRIKTSSIIGAIGIIGIAAGSIAYAQNGMMGQASQGGMMGQTTQSGTMGQATQGGMMGQATQGGMMGQATQGGMMGKTAQNTGNTMHPDSAITSSAMADHHGSK